MTQDLVDRLKAAIKLGESMGVRGNHPSNIYNLADEAVDALSQAYERGQVDMKERAAQECNLSVFTPVSDGQKVETAAEGAYYMAEKLIAAIRSLPIDGKDAT